MPCNGYIRTNFHGNFSSREQLILNFKRCISCTQKYRLHRIKLELVFSKHCSPLIYIDVPVSSVHVEYLYVYVITYKRHEKLFYNTHVSCVCVSMCKGFITLGGNTTFYGHHRYTKNQCCTNNITCMENVPDKSVSSTHWNLRNFKVIQFDDMND